MIKLALLAIASIPTYLISDWQFGICVGINDGDGVKIKTIFGKISCRLAEIDAPETASWFDPQPHGEESKEALEQLIFSRKGKEGIVWFKTLNKGRYDRYTTRLGCPRCFDINLKMVAIGAAWAYTNYISKERLPLFEKAQRRAKKKRLGLWGQSNPVAPWTWRKTRTRSGR